ncbi:MAG: ATP-binding response regulator [Pseudomonadota bacterium]
MGGSIVVESAPGAGSRFTLLLPLPRLGDASRPPVASADALRPVLAESAERPRVLAAEDNGVNQLVLRTLLAQVGIEPTITDDGVAAVEAWRSGGFDVILMDVQMPVMDGLTAARAIRAAEVAEGRSRTPIIALTANAMEHQVAEYLAAGLDGHVAKPIDAGRLYEAIAHAVAAKRARERAATA